jgi:multidrug efflux pump subunit AcrB
MWYLNSKKPGHGKFYDKTEPFFKGMENGYRRLLNGFVKVRWIAWAIIVGCLVSMFILFNSLQSELAPLEDKSTIRFQMTGPEGASYGYMVDFGDKFINFLGDSVPEKGFCVCRHSGFWYRRRKWRHSQD